MLRIAPMLHTTPSPALKAELKMHTAALALVAAWLLLSICLMLIPATRQWGAAMSAHPLLLALPSIWAGVTRRPFVALPFAVVAAAATLALAQAAAAVTVPTPMAEAATAVQAVLFVGGALILTRVMQFASPIETGAS